MICLTFKFDFTRLGQRRRTTTSTTSTTSSPEDIIPPILSDPSENLVKDDDDSFEEEKLAAVPSGATVEVWKGRLLTTYFRSLLRFLYLFIYLEESLTRVFRLEVFYYESVFPRAPECSVGAILNFL